MDILYDGFVLDREKLAHVVHYICAKCDQRALGRVKLHKILFFSDMHWFVATGKPLTGEQYQKQKFGPTARHLKATLDKLVSEEKIAINERDYYGYQKQDFVSLSSPETNVLSLEELKLLDDIIEFAKGRTATELSELSHDRSWELCEYGETIPYFSALSFFEPEITDADRDWANSEIERLAV